MTDFFFEFIAREVKQLYALHKESGVKLNLKLFKLAKFMASSNTGSILQYEGWTSVPLKDSSPTAILELKFNREGREVMISNNLLELANPTHIQYNRMK